MNQQTKGQELTSRIANPYGDVAIKETGVGSDLVASQAQAAIQGAVVMAKKYPRDERASTQRILDACTRVNLAQEAIYQFPRGGTSVTGPSIRLAEVLALKWGNIDSGIIELSSAGGRSQMMAYCWDLETNVRSQKVFMVEHVRDTRQGSKILTDQRDIYELTANQGARRMRSCILAIIPKDVIDAAVDQIHVTLSNSMEAPAEEIEGLVKAFAEYGISEAAIKKRLGKNLKSVTAAEVIRFRQIYRSIRDDMSVPGQWFELDAQEPEVTKQAKKTVTGETVKAKLRGKAPAAKPADKKVRTVEELAEKDVMKDVNGEIWDAKVHVFDKETGDVIFNADGSFKKRPQEPLDEHQGREAGDPGPTLL